MLRRLRDSCRSEEDSIVLKECSEGHVNEQLKADSLHNGHVLSCMVEKKSGAGDGNVEISPSANIFQISHVSAVWSVISVVTSGFLKALMRKKFPSRIIEDLLILYLSICELLSVSPSELLIDGISASDHDPESSSVCAVIFHLYSVH